jgi:hypothetical protein
MSMMIELMRKSKVIAQDVAPFDTGNLRYNAIHVYETRETGGFRILVRYTAAYYGTILDEFPTIYGRQNKHYGWWSTGVYHALDLFLNGTLNYKDNAYQAANENVSKYAEDNPARIKRMDKSMNPDAGREAFYAKKR